MSIPPARVRGFGDLKQEVEDGKIIDKSCKNNCDVQMRPCVRRDVKKGSGRLGKNCGYYTMPEMRAKEMIPCGIGRKGGHDTYLE